jgi:hypothetical protein
MKCPKCGYNSFEFLNACKKCGAEFVSFKKNHRISPVILTPGTAEEIRTAPVEPISSAAAVPAAVPPVIPDSVAESAADDFSWETSAEPAVAGREESPYSGFDLGFQDSADAGTQDKAFTGFSFSDEPADLHPDQTPFPEGDGLDAFTFEEAPGEKAETSPLDMKFEVPDSGPEGYENLLELDSFEETDTAGDTGSAQKKDFEADDFSFTPEPVLEDFFQAEEETVAEPPTEKKAPPNLADFDKEFEQIFSLGDAGDSGEENTKR